MFVYDCGSNLCIIIVCGFNLKQPILIKVCMDGYNNACYVLVSVLVNFKQGVKF